MRTIYFFLFALVITSCQQREEPSRVIISGDLGEIRAETLTLKTHNQLKFYEQKDISEKIKLQEDNTFSDTLELQEGHYVLEAGDVKRSLFLKSGYELKLNFKDSEMKISGKGELENQYMQEREELNAEIRGFNSYQYYSQLPEDEFLKQADSIKNLSLNLISEYEGIDTRLGTAEKNWAKVNKTDKLRMYPMTRKRFLDPDYNPSPGYPDKWAELDRNNEDLLDVPLFGMLLLSSSGADARDLGVERWKYIISDTNIKNKKIKQEVLYLAGLYTMASFEDVDGYYEKAQALITDKEKWATIDSKYKQLTRLEKGRPAPEFELKNMQGETISLDELKGNVVYLDFWASWCRPCIEEMPAFKKLQNEFSSKKIKFVSIGVESKKESLEKLLNKSGLGGLHLFDPEKEESLKKDYGVEGLPHYVLIDQQGKMIEKKAKRPSDPALQTQLRELLN